MCRRDARHLMASACGIPEVKCQLLVHTNDPFRQNNVVADEALTSTNNLRPFLANSDKSSSQCNRPLPFRCRMPARDH